MGHKKTKIFFFILFIFLIFSIVLFTYEKFKDYNQEKEPDYNQEKEPYSLSEDFKEIINSNIFGERTKKGVISTLANKGELTPERAKEAREAGAIGWTNYFYLSFKSSIINEKNEKGSLLKGIVGIKDPLIFNVKEALGFNKSLWTFIPDFITGFLIGLWIWLTYIIARGTNALNFLDRKLSDDEKKAKESRLRNSWLGFLGSNVWKIIPIAALYAAIMQVAILNRFIEVISFSLLLGLSHNWVLKSFFTSVILAVYIGILPTVIEQYLRYRIRKKYYKRILETKYAVKGAKEVFLRNS
jgi:hypothetical protein